MVEKLRWQYRFDNFKRAFLLLRESIELKQERGLSDLEKEGVVQRFEYCWELAWKVIKDYLQEDGLVFSIITPKIVIKEAVAAKFIENGEAWMSALDSRNKMSHIYSRKAFEEVISDIEDSYLALLDDLYSKLLEKVQ